MKHHQVAPAPLNSAALSAIVSPVPPAVRRRTVVAPRHRRRRVVAAALLLTLEVRATELRPTASVCGVRVHGIYDGCWSFAAGYLGEDEPVPAGWSLHLEREHPSSMRLVVDAGADPIEVTWKGGDPLPPHDDLAELF